MARDKQAWKEAKRTVDRVVGMIRSMDGTGSTRPLRKKEYATIIGVLYAAGPNIKAACGEADK